MEERHPELVIGHGGDEMRFVDERDAAVAQRAERCVEVGDPKIEDRAAVVELGGLGDAEHQPYPVAIEKAQAGESEEKWHAEGVAIEGGGAFQVAHRNG